MTPTDVPPDSEESYYSVAKRIARERPDSFYVNQYNDLDNVESHYLSTGPEIWEQTGGKIDIRVIAVDPVGSVLYDYFKSGKMIEPHVYKLEGIGEDMLVECVDFSVIDDMIQATDRDSFIMARRLAREEGLFAGGSSGSAMWAAEKVSKAEGRGKRIVVILPDHGNRYLTKLYSDDWMEEHYPGSTNS